MIWIQNLGLGTYRASSPRSPYRRIRVRQGNHADLVSKFVPADGEPAWVRDRKQLFVGDGSQLGGHFVGAGGIFYAQDAVGLEVIGFASPTVITFDTTSREDSEFDHTPGSGEVTFNTAGWYEINFIASAAMVASHAISSVRWRLELDTGSGFAATGIDAYTLHISTVVNTDGVALSAHGQVQEGHKIRFTAQGYQSAGTPSYATVPGAPRLTMQRVK